MASIPAVPVSLLDLAPVVEGSSASEALAATLTLARRAEELGLTRFWVAEHHNMPGIASSSPPVVIGAVAAATGRIRVGSGGVMLPNHPPLVVAEQFGTLAALHPGRIDLGIGRAPGTDPVTARALRRSVDTLSAEDFPEQLGELMAFFGGRFPDGHAYTAIAAVPGQGESVPLWLLGSSGYSAQVAGLLGLPFAFAHHFSAQNTLPALDLYRRSFRPSEVLSEPYAMIAVQTICGEDDAHAQWLAAPSALSFLKLRQGRPSRLPTPEQAAAYPWTDAERAFAAQRSEGQAIGGPDTVRESLTRLLEQTGANELMLTTLVGDGTERLRSLERVRSLFGEEALPVGLDASAVVSA